MSQTIVEVAASSINVLKSEFIALIFPLSSKEEVGDILSDVKKKHPKARHYCYAYVFGNFSKSSDDGEPSGTAGRPLLSLLQSENMVDVLLIVVRYFGGSKLGASLLLRTYVDAGKEVIKKCGLYKLIDACSYVFTITYEEKSNFEMFIRQTQLLDVTYEYGEQIVVKLLSATPLNLDQIKNDYKIDIKLTLEKLKRVKIDGEGKIYYGS